jgi:hypothetical protein
MVALMAGNAFAATFTSDKGGFSIELPSGWEPMPKEQLEAMAAGGTYLMATDQAALQAGKALTLAVTKTPVPAASMTTQALAAGMSGQAAAIPGVKDVKSELKKVGGTEWAVLSYTVDVSGVSAASVTYSSVKDGNLVNLVFTLDKLTGNESLVEKTVSSYKAK